MLAALAVAAAALAGFAASQARGRHPMVPPELLRSRVLVLASGTGFAFIGGYYGLVFLPASVLSGFASPLTARLTERFGPRVP